MRQSKQQKKYRKLSCCKSLFDVQVCASDTVLNTTKWAELFDLYIHTEFWWEMPMKWTTTDDLWVYFFSSFFLLKFYFYYMIWNGSLINIYSTSFIWLVRIVFVLFIIFSFWLYYTHVLYTNLYSNLWFIWMRMHSVHILFSIFVFKWQTG